MLLNRPELQVLLILQLQIWQDSGGNQPAKKRAISEDCIDRGERSSYSKQIILVYKTRKQHVH